VIGDGAFRYQLVAGDDGTLELPETMPIGVHFLELPIGVDLTRSIGPHHVGAEGEPYVEEMTFEFTAGERSCSVRSSYLGAESGLETESVAVVFSRTGEVVLGRQYTDGDEFTIRLPSRNGSDVIDVSCGDRDATRDFAAQFWEPAY
jgi:hypothetical protein